MKVSFPNTNPIHFEKEGEYQPYMDAYSHEVGTCWNQPYLGTDNVAFQFCWEGSSYAFSITIRVIVNGILKSTEVQHNVGLGNMSGGTFYTNYFIQRSVNGRNNGYCVMSEQLCYGTFSSDISVGDKVQFRVDIGSDTYVSNTIEIISTGEGTKLLHYTNSKSEILDTYFAAIPSGYDVRMYSHFLHVSEGGDKTLFESYEGDVELVSSLPKEVVKWEIGGRWGLPDYIVRHFNYWMLCDMKYIDGIAYEFSVDGNVEQSRVQGYNKSWLQVALSMKEHQWSSNYGKEDSESSIIVDDEIGGSTFPPRGGDSRIRVLVPRSTHWILSDNGTGDLALIGASQMEGVGEAEIMISVPKNTTNATITRQISVLEKSSSVVLSTKTISQGFISSGIGYGKVGDTLYIYEETKKN